MKGIAQGMCFQLSEIESSVYCERTTDVVPNSAIVSIFHVHSASRTYTLPNDARSPPIGPAGTLEKDAYRSH